MQSSLSGDSATSNWDHGSIGCGELLPLLQRPLKEGVLAGNQVLATVAAAGSGVTLQNRQHRGFATIYRTLSSLEYSIWFI